MRLDENTANGKVEWIQNGQFENGLFFKDFSRRSEGSRFPRLSIIFPGTHKKGRRKKAELRSLKRNPVRLLAVFQIS
jgi:hypothetical protein